MNIQPWTDGDLAGQEAEGYKDGQLHCKQGCGVDGYSSDTPYMTGYRRGWEEANAAGLHGTEPRIRDRRLPVWDDSCN